MATKKGKVMVTVRHPDLKTFEVYIDNPSSVTDDIMSIEGVSRIILYGHRANCLDVFIDPRYDTTEVAKEVETLLLAEVPDIFRVG